MQKPIEAEIMGAKLMRELAQYEHLKKHKEFMLDCYFDISDNGITIATSERIRRSLIRHKNRHPQAAVIADRIFNQKEAELGKRGISMSDVYIHIINSVNKISFDDIKYPASKIESILEAVCMYYGVSVDDAKGKCRKKDFVRARAVFSYFCTGTIGLRETGLHIGGRDHTTVLHLRRSIEHEITMNPELKTDINIIKAKLFV